MANGSLKGSIETPPNDNFIEVIKIDSLNELKKTLGLEQLGIEEEFKKPLITSKTELLKMKEELTRDKTSGKLRELLEGKGVISLIGSKFEKASKTVKEILPSQKVSAEQADKALDAVLETSKEVGGEAGEAVKKAAAKGKEFITQVEKSGYKTQLGAALKDSFEKLKSFNIWGALVSFFKGLFGMFAGNETLKQVGEKVSEVLDPTTPEYQETKKVLDEKVISYIEKATGTQLDKETKTRIQTKLSPNIQGSYIDTKDFSNLMEKVKSGKGISLDDIKETNILSKMIEDPDLLKIKELLSENINKKLFVFLKKKFEIAGVSFNTENEGELKSIIKKEFETTTLKELIDRTKEQGEVHFDGLEGIESLVGVGFLIPNIIFEAYEEDIVKAENLAIGLVESGKSTISIGLKALDGQDIIPDLIGRMNWDDFDTKVTELGPSKKLLLERAFYSELGLVATVLGEIGFYGSSSLVSLIEKGSNALNGKGISTPPIARLEKTLNIIGDGKGAWLKEMEEALSDTKKSYEIVEKLKNPKLSETAKKALRQDLSEISQKFTDKNIGFLSKESLAKVTKNLNPLQTFHYNKGIQELQQIVETNRDLGTAIIKGSFSKEALKAKQFIETFKIRYINGHAVLNIADELEGKQFAKAMGSLAPEIVRGMFRVAPIFLVGNTIWETTKEQEGEWYKSLLMLNGIAGGIQLFKETEVSYTEKGLEIKNPENFAGGIALVGVESFLIGKDFFKYTGGKLTNIPYAAIRAITNSFVRLPLDAVKGIGWAGVRGYEILKTAKAFLNKAPKKGKIGLGAMLLLGTVAAIEYASADEIDTDKYKKEGLIDENGNPILEKLKAKWPEFDNERKEGFISAYAISVLEKPFNGKGNMFNFALDNKIFKINIDGSLKDQQKTIQDSLEDLARFLTEIDSGINLAINFN